MFLKVLSHLILKIENLDKVEIFQNFHEIFKYFIVQSVHICY